MAEAKKPVRSANFVGAGVSYYLSMTMIRFITFLALIFCPAMLLAGLSADSGVEQTLEALDEVGKDLKSFSANVTLRETDTISQDSTSRTGMAVYALKPDGNSRFRVTFLKRIQDDLAQDQRIEYLLENNILTDRNYPRKLEIKRQMARAGEKINLLKLGEGPFPLPIGQSPKEVLNQFEVQKIAADPKDLLPQTIHLRLSPKAGSQFARKFKTLDVWVDIGNSMPRRIDTVDANETMIRGTDLSDLRLNTPLTDEHFALPPLPADWQKREEAYED